MILAIMICFMTAAKAQTYVGELSDDIIGVIPSCFTSSGHPYLIYEGDSDNYSLYQSDFITHLTDINNVNPKHFYYSDLDIMYEDDIYFTQNLFNDDDFYEYFELEQEMYYDTVYSWYDPDWDTTYYEIYVEYYTTAINVKSTNGATIWSYVPENGYTCYLEGVIKFDNRYYLMIETYDNSGGNGYTSHLFLIKQNQGVAKVETKLPISVFPTMPTRDQQITVKLGEGNNATEITVVNGLGQVVKRVPVMEGQREVTIPAHDLNSGLNVFNARTKQGQGSCKIIVR